LITQKSNTVVILNYYADRKMRKPSKYKHRLQIGRTSRWTLYALCYRSSLSCLRRLGLQQCRKTWAIQDTLQ